MTTSDAPAADLGGRHHPLRVAAWIVVAAACGVLTGANANASYVKQVDVWYYNSSGSWTVSAANPPGSTVNITRNGSQTRVDVIIAKSSGAPSSVGYFYADFANGRNGNQSSTASYYTFQDAVGSLATTVWAGINDNSDKVTINISNSAVAQPDLTVSNVTVDGTTTPGSYQEGQTVNLAAIVWNNGGATAGSSHLGYYIGTSSSSTSDRFASDSVASVTASHGQSESTSFTFRAQDVGTRYFVLVADYQGEVAEASESNNKTSFGPFQVTTAPDPCQGVKPSPPTLSAPSSAPSGADYQVTWSQPSCTTDYALEESTSPGFNSFTLIPLPAGTSSYTFNHSVGVNTPYYYRIAADNDIGQSGDWSTVASVTVTFVDPCTGVTPITPSLSTPATATSGAGYSATWNTVQCATRYLLQESTSAAFGSATNHVLGAGVTNKNLVHSVGTPTALYYRLAAENEPSGLASPWTAPHSTVVSPVNGCTGVTPPAPVSITVPASAVSDAPYQVEWTPSGPCAGSYVVEESQTAGFSSPTPYPVPVTGAGFSHRVAAPTAFFYRVAAKNGGLQSGWRYSSNGTNVVLDDSSTIAYVALGDSFSSGEGNPKYVEGTYDPKKNVCHRSRTGSYASLVHVPPLNFTFDSSTDLLACSGAETVNVLSTAKGGLPQWLPDGSAIEEQPQLDQGRVDGSTEMVTVTIGGNDLGFASVLVACSLPVEPLSYICQSLVAYAELSVPTTASAVEDVLTDILATSPRDKAAVFLLGYPHIFPVVPRELCLEAAYLPQMPAFRSIVNSLDNALEGVAAQVGVHFVDVRDAFAGHEVCTEEPWNLGAHFEDVGGHTVLDARSSFHPNVWGQQAYASALASYIQARRAAGWPLLPSGLPKNPSPSAVASPGTAGLEPTVTNPAIAALSLPPCETKVPIVKPGDGVRVEAGGFTPGAQVTVRLSTIEDGEIGQIGSLLTGNDGKASGSVTIPPDLVAPTTGLVEVAGLGSNGADRAGAASLGLVPSFESDGDGDGVPDVCDVCPAAADAIQLDYDGDGVGDACDACSEDPGNDIDQDGICAPADVCPLDRANDVDHDGYCANQDNCPAISNPDQEDLDANGLGDACELFSDGFESGGTSAWDTCEGCSGSASGTYHFRYVDSENDVAWTSVPYSGGSFSFAFDFEFASATFSGGLEAGLFDASQDGSHTAMLIAGVDGGGRHFTLSATGMGDARQNFEYQEGVWYHAEFSYSSNVAHLLVSEVGGAVVADLSLEGQPLATLSRFGIGKVDGDGNGQGIGEIDNLKVTDGANVIVETDFSVDPGLSTTDPTDFYWNPGGT